jgi:ATP-dependent helicase HrpB
MPTLLPIHEISDGIIDALRKQGRVIISAPTGSGKSTQVPQILLDRALAGQVVILQPRRLAARLLARRVASERNSQPGQEVGYQIRFENVTSKQTRIRFVTEGVLLRQLVQNPELEGISVLVFDEFHERHLDSDIVLARALDLQEGPRPDLKIVVMSATLDVEKLEEYLSPARLLSAPGRTFPVDIQYARRPSYLDSRPIWEQAAEAFAAYVESGGEGDLLVFMPGSFEIRQTIEAVRRHPASHGFVILPLHGELSPAEQDAAVARYETRKVVVATNVAETSLTIEGIHCVIDSGLARIARNDPHRGINTLLIEKISQAAAEQRAGRAGRTAPGVCLRLWSKEEHGHRPPQELPEIKRLDLAEVVLTLKAAGVDDLRNFRWLEAPEEKALARAEQLLMDLGALAHSTPGSPHNSARSGAHRSAGPITAIGRKMMSFPAHPRYARMLLAAQDFGCVYEACLIAALTNGRELLARKVDAEIARRREDLTSLNSESDLLLLMKIWEFAAENRFRSEPCQRVGLQANAARQVETLVAQFLQIARAEGLDVTRHDSPRDALQKCILIGFSDRLARRVDGAGERFDLLQGRRGSLSRESVVRESRLIVASEIREVEGKDKSVQTVLSLATAIEPQWLREFFPEDVFSTARVFFDPTARRVCAEEHVQFRDLPIEMRRVEPPPADEAARLLAEEVLAGRLPLTHWDESVEQWILRLNLLIQWCPELGLPAIGPAERRDLVQQICHGEFTYKAVKDKPARAAVQSWLSESQRLLVEKHAPERLRLANGRTPKVIYEEGKPPHVAMRIQELYDVTSTPRIAMGRIAVLLHILAPSRRPVQITQDLAGFWKEHYPRLKRELQRKYPRHEWR